MATMRVVPEDPVDTVRRIYDLEGRDAVVEFVKRSPQLIPLLVELRRQVDVHVGASAPIRLEVVTDPDEGDRALFARIRTDLSPPDALRRLDSLLDAWWLDALPRARGLLHLDVLGG